ncbi:hypothetical protein [Paenibacillus sp. FSL H8-0259]|uniref:hypothetical protein n=1 Tax=Paenibacillus sp. FSL H8-0259 TaxID=1920423 RepID=UPI00096D11C3|nr:hypothetical protein [Paenibacillus sp. FSL H8-0259]OMF27816.1 hypothetical protein BK132_16305 [Paenibacillus sp. FSL H8-0259]
MSDLFAGLGQFVSSDELTADMKTQATVKKIKDLFKVMDDGHLPNDLFYNPNARWLAGIQFKPVPFVDLAALFQDEHNRYGIFVQLLGDGAGPFAGLNGDFSYEKRKGSVGRFTGAISLPDEQRRIEMGAVTVIVPEVALDLYRNGDFKIDVGFPVGLDFSRSLCIEASPYVGWGGFYFARLSAETSAYSRVPEISATIGTFSSIIEAGLAVNLGYGKYFKRGVLNAGLSLTGIGILEGTNATFNANCDPSKNGAKFSWYQGTLGLSGKVFGEVDLKVLKAVVDCEVNATANMIIEAYKETNIDFVLEVHAHGEIEADFGIAKGKISRSFHDKMNMDFVMGKETTAPWDTCSPLQSPHHSLTTDNLVWWPVIVPVLERRKLTLYCMPQLSVGEEGGSKKVQCSAMLYMIDDPLQPDGFKAWAKGVLLWTLNAYLNRNSSSGTPIDRLLQQNITKEELKSIERYTTDGQSPIIYNQSGTGIVSFLAEYFEISICHPEIDCSGTPEIKQLVFFPVFPDIELTVEQTLFGVAIPQTSKIDFTNNQTISTDKLEYIRQHSRRMMAEPVHEDKCEVTNSHPDPRPLLSIEPSMATLWIQDVVTLCTRALAREAVDQSGLDLPRDMILISDLVDKVVDNNVRMKIVAASISQFTLFGLRVKLNEFAEQKSVYSEIGQQFPLADSLTGLTIKLERLPSNLPVTMNNCTEPHGDPSTLTVVFPKCELDRITALQHTDLPDDDWSCVRPLRPFVDVPNTYSGKQPQIWEDTRSVTGFRRKLSVFTPALGHRLAAQTGTLGLWKMDKLQTCKLDSASDEYRLATFVEVRLWPTNVPNMYELKGASGHGQLLLERLSWAIANESSTGPVGLESVHVLHLRKESDDQVIWSSDSNLPLVLSSNLTMFTEPPVNSLSMAVAQTPATFAQLLYTSGNVRSGGFCLWYESRFDQQPPDPENPILAQILFRYVNNAPLAAYVNAADTVIGPDSDESFYFLDTLQSSKPAFPSGHAGIEVYRPAVMESTDLKAYLRRMFYLIGTKLEGSLAFAEQDLSDVPIAPVGEVDVLPCELPTDPSRWLGPWYQYRPVLPIVKHAIQPPETVECGTPADNPYTGLGEQVVITLYPRDVLGNTLSKPRYNYTIPVLYRDFVVPPHQWPGTTLRYSLDLNGLVVTLAFSADGLTDEQACAAKDSYALAYHQLSQEYVEAGVTLSIDEAKTHDVRDILIEYVLECWRSLCKKLSGEPYNPVIKKCEIEPSAITLTKEKPLYELTLELTILRAFEEHIDPDMNSIPEAVSGTSRIQHESSTRIAGAQTIEAFARYFELAFDRKIGMGAWRDSEDSNRLWVVGIGTTAAACLKTERQAAEFFYGAAPFEAMKRSRTLTVQPYELFSATGGTVLADAVETESVEDLDIWVQQVFAFIDEMLDKDCLSVIGKHDGAIQLESLRKAKSDIAEAYASKVSHLGKLKVSDNSDLAAARERFKQQMLVQLAEAYKQDTVIQQPFNVEIACGDPGEMDQVSFYGPVEAESFIGLSDECKAEPGIETYVQASFTPAKLSLHRGTQQLTYLFDVKNTGHFPRYQAKGVNYRVTHLEYALVEKGVVSSAWISLIVPYDLPLGDMVIPVAIKGHPEPPLLLHHGYIDQEEPDIANAGTLLDLAKEWKYTYTYKLRQEMTAQDRLKHEIVWNEEPPVAKRAFADELPQTLAQFIHIMPDIRKALQPGADSTGVPKAVESLKKCMEQIASKWSSWLPKAAFGVNSSEPTTFDTLEQQDSSSRLKVMLDKLTGPISVGDFSMQIGKYQSEPAGPGAFLFYFVEADGNREYLQFDQRILPENTERTVRIEKFNIFRLQRSRISLYETRNENLMKCCSSYEEETVEEFVYRSPKVSLTDSIAPRLRTTREIDFSTLSGTMEHPIEEHVGTLLYRLFEDGGTPLLPHSIVCSASYKFAYLSVKTDENEDTGEPAEISVPICFKHVSVYNENEGAVAEFCRQLNECMKRKDGPLNKQGRFVIQLSIYPGKAVNANTLPVLVIEKLILPLNKISIVV